MIFISSICLNWDHYDPELPLFHFLDFIPLHSFHFKKKIIIIIIIIIIILKYLYTF